MHKVIAHRKLQQSKHICNICGKTYSRAFTLKRHKNTIHKNKKSEQSGSGIKNNEDITEQALSKKDDEKSNANESESSAPFDVGFKVSDFIEGVERQESNGSQSNESSDGILQEQEKEQQEQQEEIKHKFMIPVDLSEIKCSFDEYYQVVLPHQLFSNDSINIKEQNEI